MLISPSYIIGRFGHVARRFRRKIRQALFPDKTNDALVLRLRSDRIQGETLFSDNFDDGVIDSEWTQLSGSWTESGGVISATSGILGRSVPTPLGVHQTVTMSLGAAGLGSLLIAYTSSTRYLRTRLRADTGAVELVHYDDPTFTILNTVAYGITASTDYVVSAMMFNDLVRVWINGELVIEHTLSSGDFTTHQAADSVGFRGGGVSATTYDDYLCRTVDPDAGSAELATFPLGATGRLLAEDTFTRGDSTSLGNEEGPSGLAWSEPDSGMAIASGVLVNEGPGLSIGVLAVGSQEVDVTADVAAGIGNAYIIGMYVDTANYVFAGYDANTNDHKIWKRVSGTATNLATVAGTLPSTYRFITTTSGALYLYADDVLVATGSISAAEVATMGSDAGLYLGSGSTHSWDNFSCRQTVRHEEELLLARDTFTRPDGAVGVEEGPNALAWTEDVGDWDIEDGELRQADAGTARSVTADTGYVGQDVSATLGNLPGVNLKGIIAMSDATDYLVYGHFGDNGNSTIRHYTGVVTTSTLFTGAVVSRTAWRLICTATDAHAFYKTAASDEWVYETSVAVPAACAAGTRVGVFAQDDDQGFDNFECYVAPKVPVWPDISGEGSHATQTDPDKQPLLLPDQTDNGKAAVVFDNVNDYLHVAGLTMTQPYTIAHFYKGDGSSSDYVTDGDDATDRLVTGTRGLAWEAWTGAWLGSGVAPDANPVRFMFMANNTASKIQIRDNALVEGTSGTKEPSGINVGTNYPATGNWLDGWIAEIGAWDADQSEAFQDIGDSMERDWEL